MILFYIHYTCLLLFGVLLTASFAKVRFTKRNLCILFGISVLCGLLQLGSFIIFDEKMVWKLYPLVTHLPIVVLICVYYRKRIATAIAAVTTAYLCCQPAKWCGILLGFFTGSESAEYIARIAILIVVGALVLRRLSPAISEIYDQDVRSIAIFGSVPVVYYLFDYIMGVYTDLWFRNIRAAIEFIPFFLCLSYLTFCIVYNRENEKKMDAKRKEHIVRITAEQQAKEMEAIRQQEQKIRILRHDLRLFLNNLSLCIDEEGKDAAKKMIAGFISEVGATTVQHYCENATVNYIISDCAAKCKTADIAFSATIKMDLLPVDEILFSSILSNALDNALNAQMEMPAAQRSIKLNLIHSKNKLLLSVRNPFATKPVFVDGLPVSGRKGHGYGTQSIRYMTERLGGNCQFTTEKDSFLLRVVL